MSKRKTSTSPKAAGARRPAARAGVRKARKTRKTAAKSPARAARATIQAWQTDPMGGLPILQRPAPALPGTPLPTKIVAPATAPAARIHSVGSAGFRYWTAAEALRRSAAFWAASGARAWHRDVGATLPVRLDDGVDLNAYYARNDFPAEDIKQGLSFFHDTVRDVATGRNVTVFSGESPDVVAHELGHAVLDTLKPVLFEIASIEAAAFHESFGDMSAILTALQLPTVRQAVIEETDGNLRRNSSVSRVAEQLGFAIRQRSPAAVDRDSLRNAANAFLYVDPLTLPSSGPASQLTRAPHNLSRVFTGAFLEALGGMVLTQAAEPGGDDIEQATADMGRLLARAVADAAVSSKFFRSVAEQLVLADSALFGGKYAEALTSAFVRRNLIPVGSLAAPGALGVTSGRAAAAAVRFSASSAGRRLTRVAGGDAAPRIGIDASTLGLSMKTLYVCAPPLDDAGGPPNTMMAGMAAREVTGGQRATELHAFCEALIVRGRVSMGGGTPARRRGLAAMLSKARKHATHYLAPAADGSAELRRIAFECC